MNKLWESSIIHIYNTKNHIYNQLQFYLPYEMMKQVIIEWKVYQKKIMKKNFS